MPRRVLQGLVVSDKCHKTVTVRVERMVKHPVYKKFVKRSKKFAAHDETNQAHQGDLVEIIETPPVSKTKRWMLHSIVKRRVEVSADELRAAVKAAEDVAHAAHEAAVQADTAGAGSDDGAEAGAPA